MECQLLLVVVVALAARLAAALQAAGNSSQHKCGLASCNEIKKGMVNVHLVPHSHDDVGWLKTVDQYYYGLNQSIDIANVSEILDTVFQELIKDPIKRYIQVETVYLWMWWQHQSDKVKEQYRELVQNGRVQITGGGWTMPDEAITSHQALIDNFSWGFRFLNETFGPCGVPDVGWQIDSFGHSKEMASIMAAMGFQGVFLNRLDYQDYDKRVGDSTLELLWHASDNLGQQADIFASVLYGGYVPPTGCCWDLRCGDGDIGKNFKLVTTNFISRMNSKLKHFKTRNLMVTMGNDFTYMDANRYYRNIDEIISLVNEQQKNGSHMNLLYSTPACYLQAVNEAQQLNLTTKSDDFLPFTLEGYSVWAGYYSSRPNLKYFERLGNNFLQVSKQLTSLARIGEAHLEPLNAVRRAMATLQHHDAISGTTRQHVAQDYAKSLAAAIDGCEQLVQTALSTLLTPNKTSEGPTMKSCLLMNISECEVSEQRDSFIVTVYNPLSKVVSHYVRLPVREGTYSVTSSDGAPQTVQMIPIPSPVLDLKIRKSTAKQELIFKAADLPPLGMRTYTVSRTSSAAGQKHSRQVEDTVIGNSLVTVKIDSVTGLLDYIISNGTQISARQNFYYYESRWDDGAYAFKPRTPAPIKVEQKATYTVYKGELVEEIHQIFNDWVSQVIRVYKDEYHVEFEWLVGTIPVAVSGKQIISKFLTNVQSNQTYYTDSNGREVQMRVRNYRETFALELDEPVSSNYFPVSSRIFVKDDAGLEFAVLTDRPQGGASMAHGQLELMVHRRMQTDDFFGLNEVMNDTQQARGKHFVVCGESSVFGGLTLAARQRQLAEKILLRPWVFLGPSSEWPEAYKYQYAGLQKALPDNVHVLTLEPWGDNRLLLRLEHIMEKTDDPQLSQNVTVNLEELFSSLTVSSFRETTLDGNRWLSDVKRFTWQTTEGSINPNIQPSTHGPLVTLTPMQMKTFVLTIKHS